MTVLYIDCSHHDWNRRGGDLDWGQVLSVTSPVMCARATYGDPAGFSPTTYHFADFQTGAQAAGFSLRGGYHNLVRGDSASMRRQVDWFRSELDAQGCHWAMLDIERYKELVERDLWPRWADVLRFRDAWHAVESRPLAYYLPRWILSGYYGSVDLRELPGPWVQSHYLSGIYGTPTQIYAAGGGDSGTGWDDCWGNRCPDIWQYSATCDVAGASSQTDVNAFRGTLDQLRVLITGDGMSEQTEEHVEYLAWRVEGLVHMRDQVLGGPGAGEEITLVQAVKELRAKVESLTAPAPVDIPALVAALRPEFEAAAERAVRRVMLDAATPDEIAS